MWRFFRQVQIYTHEVLDAAREPSQVLPAKTQISEHFTLRDWELTREGLDHGQADVF